MWESNGGRAWVSLGGVGHAELSEGFFRLTSIVKWIPSFTTRLRKGT